MLRDIGQAPGFGIVQPETAIYNDPFGVIQIFCKIICRNNRSVHGDLDCSGKATALYNRLIVQCTAILLAQQLVGALMDLRGTEAVVKAGLVIDAIGIAQGLKI